MNFQDSVTFFSTVYNSKENELSVSVICLAITEKKMVKE